MDRIRTDQIGYGMEEKKQAVFPNAEYVSFEIMNISTNDIVLRGETGAKKLHEASGEEVSIADFSELKAEGSYCIFCDSMEPSYPFHIGEGAYYPVMIELFRMFYLQRCGMHLTKEYAGIYSHTCCHASDAYIYGTNETKNVTGGWHDAGDYGRYVVAGAVTVADLLLAWNENRAIFDRQYHIPNDTGLPDYLAEIKYELDWMLKMQDEKTGEVYHKVTCEQFPGFVMPQKEKEKLVISPASPAATADFAASLAMAYDVYKEYDRAYADTCLQAAKYAYEALAKMPSGDGFHNPEGVVTGEYGDTCDVDERYWASAELYKATGEEKYHEQFKQLAQQKILHGYGWENVGSFGNQAYLTCEYPVDKELWSTIKHEVIDLGQKLAKASEEDAYGTARGMNYVWGSNMEVANEGISLYQAYTYKKEKRFAQAAREQIHYLFGKNPMDICYVTGMGSVSPEHPHHRPSAAMKKAQPGMLVGGPDMGLHDEVGKELLKDVPPAKCYLDVLDSYSTNEITIYWNAPLIYLLAFALKER